MLLKLIYTSVEVSDIPVLLMDNSSDKLVIVWPAIEFNTVYIFAYAC
jgi:hypothetical protein